MRLKLLPLALSILLAACGGGGGGSTPSPTPSPTPTSTTQTTLPVDIPAATYAAGSVELGAWNALQLARVTCGFGALKQNPQLDAAALAHARYLNNISLASGTSVLSHYEKVSSDPYYTGYYPWDRTAHQGYGTQVAEILEATYWTYDVSNPPAFPGLQQRGAASVRNLLNTVYHLIGAMYDGADVGFGADLQTAVNGSARREEYRFGSLIGYQTQHFRLGSGNLATYPCEGSSDIPPAFAPAYETPNPFPAMTDTSQKVGPPIYLKVDAGQVLTLTSASLTNSSGVNIQTTWLTAGNDPQAEISANEIFVVPNSVLSSNTSYQVNLAGSIDGKPFSRSFTLRTGSP